MKLVRCTPRHTSDYTPEPEVLPPTMISYRRGILLVEDVAVDEQQHLYHLRLKWDACHYAGSWAVPVHQVRHFCADFSAIEIN